MSLSRNDKGFPAADDQVPAPPDGGYGWVIVFLAGVNMVFVLGVTYSVGTLLDTLVQVFFSNIGLPIDTKYFNDFNFAVF